MQLTEIQNKYTLIVSATKLMLQAQQEYFRLTEQLNAERLNPELFETTAKNAYKKYTHFLDRVRYLQSSQTEYFRNTSNRSQLDKCKALEREIMKLIKDKKIADTAVTLF